MDDLQPLHKRIAELEAENAEFRRRPEPLEHELQEIYRRKGAAKTGARTRAAKPT